MEDYYLESIGSKNSLPDNWSLEVVYTANRWVVDNDTHLLESAPSCFQRGMRASTATLTPGSVCACVRERVCVCV